MKSALRHTVSLIRLELFHSGSRSLLIVWALTTVFIGWAMSIGAIQIQSGSSGVGGIKSHVTSEFAQALQSAVIGIMIDGFFFAVLAGMSVPKDHESRVLDIEKSCGLSERSYVTGKFLSAAIWLMIMMALQVISRIVFNHVIPNADMDDSRGTFHLTNYIRPMLLIILPGLLFNGSISFYLGAKTRNSVMVFLSPVFLLMAYSFLFSETLLQNLPVKAREVVRLTDPSGTEWLNQTYLREDRGANYYNLTPIQYHYDYLISRSLFLLATLVFVFRSAKGSMTETSRTVSFGSRIFRPRKSAKNFVESDINQSAILTLSDLEMKVRRPSWSRQVLVFASLELKSLMKGPGIWLFGILIALIATVVAALRPGPLGTAFLVTSGNFVSMTFPLVSLSTCMLTLFFGSDAMLRERSSQLESLVFASPVNTSAWLTGKTLACSVVGLLVVISSFIGLCVVMAWQGKVWPEFWPLFCVWGCLLPPTFLFWSSLIALFRAVTSSRSMILALGFLIFGLTILANLRGYINWANNWLLIGPNVIWSDISQFESQRKALVTNRITMISGSIFLLILASIILNRVESDLVQSKSRNSLKNRFIRYYPAIIAVIPFLSLSSLLYFEIRRGPEGSVIQKRNRDYWKRNVNTFFEFKSPAIDETKIDIRIKPESRSFQLRGSYLIRNSRDLEITEFPVTLGRHIRNAVWKLNDQPFIPEDRSGLTIIRKPDRTGINPGESLLLGFEYDAVLPGGMSRNGINASEFILPSSIVLTSFSTSFLPKLGFQPTLGLDPKMIPDGKDYPEDYYLQRVEPALGDGAKMKTNIAITVPSGFRANSVGVLDSVTQNAEDSTTRYVWRSDYPVSFFNIVAGRWEEATGEGVSVFYDKRHVLNVPEMVRALEASRKYYSEWFGEFPWKQLKLSEFAGLATYAQGFPTNITFSESIGFQSLSRPDSNVAFYVTAHEAAHQWWGNLLVPGQGPGGNILSESLANYSAIALIDQVLGEQARMGLTKEMELDYIRQRQGDDERPLVKIDGRRATDTAITYSRGGWVFWMLANLMGRENFHRGLADMVRKYPAGSEDAPLVEDLLATMKPYAPDQMQFDEFSRQWILGTVLPNLFLDDLRKVENPDHTWTVSGTLRNEGTGSHHVEIAATAGTRFADKKASQPSSEKPKVYQSSRTEVKIEQGKGVTFKIQVNFEPETVVVDPDQKLLFQGRERLEKSL